MSDFVTSIALDVDQGIVFAICWDWRHGGRSRNLHLHLNAAEKLSPYATTLFQNNVKQVIKGPYYRPFVIGVFLAQRKA